MSQVNDTDSKIQNTKLFMISLHSFLRIFSTAYVQHIHDVHSRHHLVFLVAFGLRKVDCQAQGVHFQVGKVLVENICPIEQDNYLITLIQRNIKYDLA